LKEAGARQDKMTTQKIGAKKLASNGQMPSQEVKRTSPSLDEDVRFLPKASRAARRLDTQHRFREATFFLF
jgi:hypothetical protein